jgi:phage host-nuclease inhibitor protein Gam
MSFKDRVNQLKQVYAQKKSELQKQVESLSASIQNLQNARDGLYARGDIQRYKQEVAPFLVLGTNSPREI